MEDERIEHERPVELIVIHCADTPPGMDIGAKQIREWHLDRGWSNIGYHYVIRRNGEAEVGRDEAEVGAHAYGHNARSIGICLVGGGGGAVDYTAAQWDTLKALVMRLKEKYKHFGVRVCGHNDLDHKKTCPNFNVKAWAGGS